MRSTIARLFRAIAQWLDGKEVTEETLQRERELAEGRRLLQTFQFRVALVKHQREHQNGAH